MKFNKLRLKDIKHVTTIILVSLFLGSCTSSRETIFSKRKYYNFKSNPTELALRTPSEAASKKHIIAPENPIENNQPENSKTIGGLPADGLIAQSQNPTEAPAKEYEIKKKAGAVKKMYNEIMEQAMSKYKIENEKEDDNPVLKDHPYAIGSLITGIITFFTPSFYVTSYSYYNWGIYAPKYLYGFTTWGIALAVTSIVFGVLALKRIKQQPDKYQGKRMAWAAIILGIVKLLISLFAFL